MITLPVGAIPLGCRLDGRLVHQIDYSKTETGQSKVTLELSDFSTLELLLVEGGPKVSVEPWPSDRPVASCMTDYEVVLSPRSDHPWFEKNGADGEKARPKEKRYRFLCLDRVEAKNLAWAQFISEFPKEETCNWDVERVSRMRKQAPVVVRIDRPRPDKPGYLKSAGARSIDAIYADLVEGLHSVRPPWAKEDNGIDEVETYPSGIIDEYFSSVERWRAPELTGKSPMPEGQIEWSAQRGGSEGWYIHGRLVPQGGKDTFLIFLGKTFQGLEHAYLIARWCAQLTGE